MYEKLVSGRPWLEKLLCREEFTSHGMVSPKNMEDVITDWEGCFQRVKVLLDKYRLMEDRQIGRIASWVMEHVDEKVTLKMWRRMLQLQSVIPVPSIFSEYSERKQVSHQLSGRKTGTVCRKIDTSF